MDSIVFIIIVIIVDISYVYKFELLMGFGENEPKILRDLNKGRKRNFQSLNIK